MSIEIKNAKQEHILKYVGIENRAGDMASTLPVDMEHAAEILEKSDADYVRYTNGNGFPSIKLGTYTRLDGSEGIAAKEVGDGSIIKFFDKTPFPKKATDVVCPHFLELKWANGCDFNCAWCYLQGTFRFRPMGKKPYLKDEEKIKEHVSAFLEKFSEPAILNSGELADSLVFEGNGFSLVDDIVPLFKEQDKHRLLILTKSNKVDSLLKADAQKQVVVSFTVNAYPVAKKWEKRAPSPKKRIEAARKLQETGYEVRLRIDPMVPIDSWEAHYKTLVDDVFSAITPERITLGSLRGLQSTINNANDKTWTKYLDEKSNWGRKIGFGKRYEMYSLIIDYLDSEYDYDRIGVCKETVEMWDELGLDYKNIRCNCLL